MRTVGSKGELTQKKIHDAAIKLIAVHGYEAVSLRQIASAVRLQVGSLYNHISNKQELLYNLLYRVTEDAIEALKAAAAAQPTSIGKLRAFVRLHIAFHIDRKDEVLIATAELRSLTAHNFRRITRLRDEYSRCVQDILQVGRDDGSFSIDNVRLCTFALIAMLTNASAWFDRRGPLSREDVISYNESLSLKMVGATPARAPKAL